MKKWFSGLFQDKTKSLTSPLTNQPRKNMNTKRNLLAEEMKKQREAAPLADQEEYEELSENQEIDIQLRCIKKSKTDPETGDVFAVNPIKGVYFRGFVLEASVQHIKKGHLNDGKTVIAIYRTPYTSIEAISTTFREDEELLFELSIVSNDYWKKGYFYTVGKASNEVKIEDYGFYLWSSANEFYDSKGNPLNHTPKIYGGYGVMTMIGVAMGIQREIILDKSILANVIEWNKEIYPMKKKGKEKIIDEGYMQLIENARGITIVLNVQDEKVLSIGKAIEEKHTEALMNGYNWESVLKSYLKKTNPRLLMGLESDPEAGMLTLKKGPKSKKTAQKLFELIKELIENETKIYEFIQQYSQEIEWES